MNSEGGDAVEEAEEGQEAEVLSPWYGNDSPVGPVALTIAVRRGRRAV